MTDQTSQQTAVSERKAAEQEYSITAFDYIRNPVGSRDWCLYWDGYQAALKHAQQAVESEREKVLEEVAQALLDAGYGEAYEVVYKLQTQQPAAIESEWDKALAYPDTLYPDLAEILGKPNFWCGPIAHVFQAAGYEIQKKAEAEQAFVLHWLIKIYLQHGADWRTVANKELNELVSKLKSQQPAQADKDKP